MGWTSSYIWNSKQSMVNHCIDESTWGAKTEVIKHSVRGNHVWVLVKDKASEEISVVLFLISKFNDGEWGYKDLCDSSGPFYYDCPVSFIKSTQESPRKLCDRTKNWHTEVKQFHAKERTLKKKLNALVPGDRVEYGKVIYVLVEKLGRLGWNVINTIDGIEYRMKTKQLKASKVLAS